MTILCDWNLHKWSQWGEPFPIKGMLGNTNWYQVRRCHRCAVIEKSHLGQYPRPKQRGQPNV